MKFDLRTARSFYKDAEKDKLDKLGFRFETRGGWKTEVIGDHTRWWIVPGGVEINFHTMEELMGFVAEWDELLITEDTITIVDDYL